MCPLFSFVAFSRGRPLKCVVGWEVDDVPLFDGEYFLYLVRSEKKIDDECHARWNWW